MNRHFLTAGASALAVFGLCFIGQAQVSQSKVSKSDVIPKSAPEPKINPEADKGWTKCSTSPAQVASETDRGLSYLKNSGCIAIVSYTGKDGHGSSQCTSVVKDTTTFHVEFPEVLVKQVNGGGVGPVITKAWANANGSRLAIYSGSEAKIDNKPLSAAKYRSKVSPAEWTLAFPKVIFSALRSGHPFGDLVAAASKPGSGLSVNVEEKKFSYKGQIIHQRRLTIKKLDPSHGQPLMIQATIDASRWLPVTIQTTGTPLGRPAMNVLWRAQWASVNPKKFTPSMFAVPNV